MKRKEMSESINGYKINLLLHYSRIKCLPIYALLELQMKEDNNTGYFLIFRQSITSIGEKSTSQIMRASPVEDNLISYPLSNLK